MRAGDLSVLLPSFSPPCAKSLSDTALKKSVIAPRNTDCPCVTTSTLRKQPETLWDNISPAELHNASCLSWTTLWCLIQLCYVYLNLMRPGEEIPIFKYYFNANFLRTGWGNHCCLAVQGSEWQGGFWAAWNKFLSKASRNFVLTLKFKQPHWIDYCLERRHNQKLE